LAGRIASNPERTAPSSTVTTGFHILRARGIDVDALPREIILKTGID
jgi:hypothetical protein